MTRTKLLFRATLTVTLTLALLESISYPQSGRSQSLEPAKDTPVARQLHFEPPPPPDKGEPGGRGQGGASRGPCQKYESLTALVPVTKTATKNFVWGSTVAEHPTFWFHVPDKLTPGIPVEFVLQDEADNYVYRTTFTPPDTPPGIVSLSVPPTAAPLKVGKPYRWTFSIYCDPAKPSASVFVRGSVQRVALAPEVQRQIETAKTPLERAALYAANGIWYEALTTLGEQIRGAGPKDRAIATAWADLLQQVGLGSSASAPFVPCCTPK